MIRNIAITDCTTLDKYIRVMKIVEDGCTTDDAITEFNHYTRDYGLEGSEVLFDCGDVDAFMYYWGDWDTASKINKYNIMTCQELFDRYENQ